MTGFLDQAGWDCRNLHKLFKDDASIGGIELFADHVYSREQYQTPQLTNKSFSAAGSNENAGTSQASGGMSQLPIVRCTVVFEGYGGYSISGFDPRRKGKEAVKVSYSVVGITETASFTVKVKH
ncbi:hypothetical protein QL093DRAFT_2081365 [Fusarium oxysporum]|nr:hypothetical protein QL093DRAFT_2081365 [Fusarium oxysporum]